MVCMFVSFLVYLVSCRVMRDFLLYFSSSSLFLTYSLLRLDCLYFFFCIPSPRCLFRVVRGVLICVRHGGFVQLVCECQRSGACLTLGILRGLFKFKSKVEPETEVIGVSRGFEGIEPCVGS